MLAELESGRKNTTIPSLCWVTVRIDLLGFEGESWWVGWVKRTYWGWNGVLWPSTILHPLCRLTGLRIMSNLDGAAFFQGPQNSADVVSFDVMVLYMGKQGRKRWKTALVWNWTMQYKTGQFKLEALDCPAPRLVVRGLFWSCPNHDTSPNLYLPRICPTPWICTFPQSLLEFFIYIGKYFLLPWRCVIVS